jgi:diguanylate cyclase (GGDEF)-like protein
LLRLLCLAQVFQGSEIYLRRKQYMVDPHSMQLDPVQLAGFVSQATFALTLTMLAWSDRRSHGMVWLAGACGLQLFASISRSMWATEAKSLNDAAGSCLLILLFFFVYMGLRWFVVRRKLRSIGGPLCVSLSMVLVLAINPFSDALALALARITALIIMGKTVEMLLNTRFRTLRGNARITAVFLTCVICVVAFRLPIDLQIVHVSKLVITCAKTATMVFATLLLFSFVGIFVAESKRRLHDETRIDSLTGLRNRRAMEEIAQHEVGVSLNTGRSLAMLMMDVDHFKRLNDTWGHGLGDRALRAIGGVLLTVTGADDRVMRMGGEEFAVLLPGYDMNSAARIAERLRATVEGLRLNENDEIASFTISIGVGVWREGERGWADMLRRADVALYRAKREGRNRVVTCSETPAALQKPSPAVVMTNKAPVIEGRAGWRSASVHRTVHTQEPEIAVAEASQA